MKKFLFTLAALLMAGSICAEDYMYIEDFTVPQSVLQGATAKARRMDVSVMAHFEGYVNTWMTDVLPSTEAMTLKIGVEGEGMTVPYLDKMGNNKTASVALNSSDSGTRFIGVLTMAGYWYPEGLDPDEDDPVTYGSVKFALGDYEMFIVTLQFDPTFTGGTIDVICNAVAMSDTRGACAEGVNITKTCNVSIEQLEPVVAEAPVFEMDENYTITATCDNDYKAFINGEQVTLPYTVAQTYEEQTITVTGYGYGEEMENSDTVEYIFTVPAMERPVTPEPEINVEYGVNNASATITIEGEGTIYFSYDGENWLEYDESIFIEMPGEYTIYAKADNGGDYVESGVVSKDVTIEEKPIADAPDFFVMEDNVIDATCDNDYKAFINGQEVTLPYVVEQTYEEQTITVTGYGYGENMQNSATVQETFIIPALERPVTPEPTIYVEYGENNTSATITIEGEGTIYYSFDGQNWDEYTDAIVIDVPGEYTIYAKADNGGDYVASDITTETVKVEAAPEPMEKTGNPSISANAGDQSYTVVVTAPATDPDADLFYRVRYENGEWSDWMPYTGEVVFTEFGYYEVEAYAQADGKDVSNPVSVGFYLDENTSAAEILGGKTVASTRYFNMAGQEMSEANGVCIIVTTFTDGTTSAVKVMK